MYNDTKGEVYMRKIPLFLAICVAFSQPINAKSFIIQKIEEAQAKIEADARANAQAQNIEDPSFKYHCYNSLNNLVLETNDRDQAVLQQDLGLHCSGLDK